MEKTRAQAQVAQKKFHLDIKKNNLQHDQLPEQPPHGCGRVSITGDFQDATGH